MTKPRSLEKSLVVRLGVVLFLAFSGLIAWLIWHLQWTDSRMDSSDPHAVMAEFFVDIAWTVPVISVVTIVAAALSVRRCVSPLNDISQKAAAIQLGSLHQRLPVDDVPQEIVPLVDATNVLLGRVEAGFAEQRRFTENVAHELRTPLQVIAAGLEAKEHDPEIATLKRDVRRMTRMVAQLLAVARLDTYKDAGPAFCDLAVVAADTLAFLAPLASRREVELSLERPSSSVMIMGDSDLVGDVIRNLVENAVFVSNAGDEVIVVVAQDGTIEVLDQGPGISLEHRDRVFERFWRMAENTSDGSGLGLAIVKEIIELIGGEIEIRDNTYRGTIVRVRFPMRQRA